MIDDTNQHPDFLALQRRVQELENRSRVTEDMLLLLMLTQGALDLMDGLLQAARTGLVTADQAVEYERRINIMNQQTQQISAAYNKTSGELIKEMWARPDRPVWMDLANQLGKTPEELWPT